MKIISQNYCKFCS